MRVAFTGKGGSGKSTLCALFIEHLRTSSETVLAIDADINIHLGSLIGAVTENRGALSTTENVALIRQQLAGTNPVATAERFVKTTPPGRGSNRVRIEASDPIIENHTVALDATTFFAHVGTYESADIGSSCYHVNLGILENVLSHLEDDDAWIVCDMVAGTDAFSNTLHAQFDAIVVVVEPTPESISVACRYRDLATEAGTADVLFFVGNKIDNSDDLAYLEGELGTALHSCVPSILGLRRARQQSRRPMLDHVGERIVFKGIENAARTTAMSPDRRWSLLRNIHFRLAQEEWVRNTYGDITDQWPPS